MNRTTESLLSLLVFHNMGQMAVMFKQADSIEEFATSIETYVRTSLIEEAEWDVMAQTFAELPFREER